MIDKFREHRKLQEAYKNVFSTPEGIKVLADLAGRFSVFDPTVGQRLPSDYLEGQRSVVLQILKRTKTPKETFEKILEAHYGRRHGHEPERTDGSGIRF